MSRHVTLSLAAETLLITDFILKLPTTRTRAMGRRRCFSTAASDTKAFL